MPPFLLLVFPIYGCHYWVSHILRKPPWALYWLHCWHQLTFHFRLPIFSFRSSNISPANYSTIKWSPHTDDPTFYGDLEMLQFCCLSFWQGLQSSRLAFLCSSFHFIALLLVLMYKYLQLTLVWSAVFQGNLHSSYVIAAQLCRGKTAALVRWCFLLLLFVPIYNNFLI